MATLRACGVTIVGLIILSIMTYSGCNAMGRAVVDWRQSDNGVKIARIETNGMIEATRIQTDGAVQIARINADAAKKTSWAYVGYYALNGAYVVAGLIWAAVAVLVWRKHHGQVRSVPSGNNERPHDGPVM